MVSAALSAYGLQLPCMVPRLVYLGALIGPQPNMRPASTSHRSLVPPLA
jgi:hypothetical protein